MRGPNRRTLLPSAWRLETWPTFWRQPDPGDMTGHQVSYRNVRANEMRLLRSSRTMFSCSARIGSCLTPGYFQEFSGTNPSFAIRPGVRRRAHPALR